MFFVIDKPRLQRIIAIVRDDRTRKTQGAASPYMRMEARDGYLKLDGLEASATFPATVYEPGVLFLKITRFRRLLRAITKQKMLAIQVNQDGLLVDNVVFPMESNDMLLYPDPDQAPPRYPEQPDPGEPPTETGAAGEVATEGGAAKKAEPTLWDIMDKDPPQREG